MLINYSYHEEFTRDFDILRGKRCTELLLNLDGIGSQLDVNEFSRNFFSKKGATTADVSVDANSNVDIASAMQYHNELAKPLHRLNAYYLLWKYARQLYHSEAAYKMIEAQFEKAIYINDFHTFGTISYCFNFSCMDVLTQGLPFVRKIKSAAPRHLSSFMGQLVQFVTYASNSIAGAVGLADLLICASHFVDKMFDTNKEVPVSYLEQQVKQELQSFIYSVNQPFRGSIQSPFTNVSIYDKTFLTKLCSEYVFPDGTSPSVRSVQRLQNIFVDLMNETLRVTPCTFPVTTACFAVDDNGNILDEEFLDFVTEKNMEFGFMNMYAGKTSTLSSCCFTGETPVLTRDSTNGVMLSSIASYHALPWESKKNTKVYHDGSWVKAKTISIQPAGKMLTITTANKKSMDCTDDHIFPTLRGDVAVKDLTTNDYIMVSTSVLNPEGCIKTARDLSYNDGLLIGAYLGDGSIYYKDNGVSVEVTLSISREKSIALESILGKETWHEYPVVHNCISFKSYKTEIAEFIETWAISGKAPEKRLKLSVLDQPIEFRQGILDGWYITDGGNSNRAYTTSCGLAQDMEVLLTSLGMISVIDISDRTDEKVVIRGEEWDRNHPLYCVRWYTPRTKRSMDGVYIKHNGNMFFKVTDITEKEHDGSPVYCFETYNKDEPYFTLPGGIVTHNCRLRSEAENEYFNMFGSGGTKIGSQGIVTLNLPRYAYIAQDREDFFKILTDYVELASQINHVKRFILKKRVDNGNLPLYDLGFMSLTKQYSTCGIVGLNEALRIMGMDIVSQEGQEFVLRILKTVNEVNDKQQKKTNTPHNMEQVPGESSAVKLAEADRILGYNKEYSLYSNQFIPLTAKADMIDRIRLQGLFDGHMSGGAICHLNIVDRITDRNFMRRLIQTAINKGVIYFAVNYNLQRCEKDHMSVGKVDVCPSCGSLIVSNFTRVVGFLVDVRNFHSTRRTQDYPVRQFYTDAQQQHYLNAQPEVKKNAVL